MAMTVVRRVGVLSVAKLQAVLYLIIGFLVGGMFALFSLFGAAAGSMWGNGNNAGPLVSALFGVGAIVFFPILYGVLGFIGGLILGALYNLVAGMTGGVEIELG
jgi:hypothetical protein